MDEGMTILDFLVHAGENSSAIIAEAEPVEVVAASRRLCLRQVVIERVHFSSGAGNDTD